MKQSWKPYATAQVPRYTSYPTAVDFKAEIGVSDAKKWAAAIASDETISAYVHVPFCDQLCWYCGCATSVPNGYKRIADFVAALHQEIDIWAETIGPNTGLKHLHFGGGSPNALSCGDFEAIAQHVQDAFGARSDLQFDVELDPRALDEDFIDAMADSGVSRVSLGVQTLSPAVQRAVNRIQPRAMITEAVAHLRRSGIQSINVDLMYGLPNQTVEDVVEAAQYAAEIGINRVAVFGYAHVPWFAKHQKAIDETALPDLDARFEQAEAVHDILTDAGYLAIGLDHYALPGDAMTQAVRDNNLHRSFQGYTEDTCSTLIGLGPSSISQFSEGYVQSFKGHNQWRDAVEAGVMPSHRGVALTEDDKLYGRAIERLMCELQLDVDDVCREMQRDPEIFEGAFDRARALASDGLCEIKGRTISVPEAARPFVRNVAACFDPRLQTERNKHALAI